MIKEKCLLSKNRVMERHLGRKGLRMFNLVTEFGASFYHPPPAVWSRPKNPVWVDKNYSICLSDVPGMFYLWCICQEKFQVLIFRHSFQIQLLFSIIFMYEINIRASVAESVKCWTTEVFISCRGRKFYPRYFSTVFRFRPAFCRVVNWILSSGIKGLGHNPLRIQYRGSECVGLHRCGIYIYMYYLLTPWSRVLLEKLTSYQLVKKFPSFYGTRRFITV
jgi:hypothetical protein